MRVPRMADNDAVTLEALQAEHGKLEKRLAELDGHLYLSPAQQAERTHIKKLKLHLKDRMATLGRQQRAYE